MKKFNYSYFKEYFVEYLTPWIVESENYIELKLRLSLVWVLSIDCILRNEETKKH